MTFKRNFFRACTVALSAVICCNAAHAIDVSLSPNWTEWDPFNLGSGVQTLSGESSTGYTTTLSGAVGETGEIAQVYQIFSPLRLNNVGDKVELSFDVQFNTLIGNLNLDTDFRFGLGSTENNTGGVVGIDAGSAAGGTSVRMRMDANGITHFGDPADPGYPNAFDANNYNHSLNASGTLGQSSATPSGNVIGESTTEIHSFVYSLERGAGGISGSMEWTDDNTGATTVSAGFTDFDDTLGGLITGKMREIDLVQFAPLEEVFFENYPGSFTISNVRITGTPVPEPTSVLLAVGSMSCLALRRRRSC